MAETKRYLDLTGLSKYDAKMKSYIGTQIANAEHLKREKVETLPSVSAADAHTIYLVKRNKVG